jgi:hypothetical protein
MYERHREIIQIEENPERQGYFVCRQSAVAEHYNYTVCCFILWPIIIKLT